MEKTYKAEFFRTTDSHGRGEIRYQIVDIAEAYRNFTDDE